MNGPGFGWDAPRGNRGIAMSDRERDRQLKAIADWFGEDPNRRAHAERLADAVYDAVGKPLGMTRRDLATDIYKRRRFEHHCRRTARTVIQDRNRPRARPNGPPREWLKGCIDPPFARKPKPKLKQAKREKETPQASFRELS